MIKLIVFDLDDTLIYTYKNYYKRVKKAAKLIFNVNITKKRFDKFYGKPGFKENMKLLLEKKDIDNFIECFNELVKENKYQKIISDKYLDKLRKEGINIGIISNALREKNTIKMNHANIEYFFNFIYSFEDLKNPKPDTEIIDKIIDEKKYLRSEIMYVGDSVIDMEFANDAYICFVPVRTGKDKWKSKKSYKNVNRFLRKFLKNFERNK